MTVFASTEIDRIGILPLVTLLTIHANMLSFQRKIRGAMVKGSHGFYGNETCLCMAFGTVVSHLPTMNILVAGSALRFTYGWCK